jgi:hypothetical protein
MSILRSSHDGRAAVQPPSRAAARGVATLDAGAIGTTGGDATYSRHPPRTLLLVLRNGGDARILAA